MSLTAFSKLINRHNLNSDSIGRIDVGSESNPDRAKAIKSHLMCEIGRGSVAGSDCLQACYGGTGALLNALAWLESSQYEPGKYAIVIAADIAVYAPGPARATGGAGAVAILLGRSAETYITIEKIFGHSASHHYDFYKPNPFSEFPIVDGSLSITAYLQSALFAYSDWLKKENSLNSDQRDLIISERFDRLIFHSPYSKIVYKAFCQLQLLELGNNTLKLKNISELPEHAITELDHRFKQKVEPGLKISKNIGNSYCASIFCNLLSCLMDIFASNGPDSEPKSSRIGAFSYGSGSMATYFSFRTRGGSCDWLSKTIREVSGQLENRVKLSPLEYENSMKKRSEMYGIVNWNVTEPDLDILTAGTFYLSEIDNENRRFYLRK